MSGLQNLLNAAVAAALEQFTPGHRRAEEPAVTIVSLCDLKNPERAAHRGNTSLARHDAARVELPAGGNFALVIFTERHSEAKEIIPAIARRIVDGFETCHASER